MTKNIITFYFKMTEQCERKLYDKKHWYSTNRWAHSLKFQRTGNYHVYEVVGSTKWYSFLNFLIS